MSKDNPYDLHLTTDKNGEFGVLDPQFKLGSSWLVGTEASFARVSVGVGMLVEVDLIKGHCSPKVNFLPVGFH